MGIKTGIGLGVLAAIGVGLGGFGTYMGIMNQPEVKMEGEASKVDLSLVAGVTPDADGDVVVPLTRNMLLGNTELVWHIGKDATGIRHDYDGTWEQMNGAVVFNTTDSEAPALSEIRAVELRIYTGSITGYGSEHRAATGALNALKGDGDHNSDSYERGWFDVKTYPDAIYTCDDIQPRDATSAPPPEAVEGWTHIMHGQFDVNGKSHPLAIAMIATLEGEALVMTGRFTFDRNDYDISGDAGDSIIDDMVFVDFSIHAEPNTGQDIDALNALIAEQTNKNELLSAEVEVLRRGQRVMQETLGNIERQLAQIAMGNDAADLPERFTDSYDFTLRIETDVEGEFDEEGKQVVTVSYAEQPISVFDMILVPGDPEKGIAPFYMSETEVPWNRLEYWAFCRDIDTDTSVADIAGGLRPTPLFGNTEQTKLGFGPLPAIGLSRRTAEAYCKWLSLETGRQYRLPTAEEWEYAVVLGGGIPTDREELLAHAILLDNAPIHVDTFGEMSKPVGSMTPNALGIYDLLGSAAEWVSGTGADRIVRGGHFQTPADDLTLDWQAIEDQDIWNANYPNSPKSKYWYLDHYYQGIRLVCDPVNIPTP